MIRFLITRLGRALITVILIVTFAFVVLRLSGDPAERFFDPNETPKEVIDAFRTQWGLDRPIWEQYLAYGRNVLRGDLGDSIRENRSAVDAVADKIPVDAVRSWCRR